jgi:23S rRNA (guanine745-N1)-methyltransferase
MDPAVLAALLCPSCAAPFDPAPGRLPSAAADEPEAGTGLQEQVPATGQALVCRAGHSFDRARQGYVNFLTGAGTPFVPDTAAMVEARDQFLQADHYRPLASAVAARAVAALPPAGLVVDTGTGTGYYLRAVLDRAPAGTASIGLDLSKFALRRAGRANPATLNLVWDLWRPLPLAASCADVVLVVFAPRNPPEYARILRPGGILLVVTPLPGHLAEIAGVAGLLGMQADKQEALAASLAGAFDLSGEEDLDYVLRLDRAEVARAALMGPAGHHSDPTEVENRVAALADVTEVRARFRISAFTPVPVPPVAARRKPGQDPQVAASGPGRDRQPGPPATTGT